MKKIVFRFPSGAGGNWLRHICYCAENNDYAPVPWGNYVSPEIAGLNFHVKERSYNVVGIHYEKDVDVEFLLSSKYKFNLYLNALLKNKLSIPDEWYRDADPYATFARFIQSEEYDKRYQQNIDIDISWTVTDPDRLFNTLFDILDKNDISYVRNSEGLEFKLKHYIDTCIDPYKHLGNLQCRFWQAWCLGFIHDAPISFNNEQEVLELIQEKQDYYIEKTQSLSYSLW